MTSSGESEDIPDVILGVSIRNIRCRRHMTQATLAAKLGMQPAQLCNIEKGKNSPSLRTITRIAAALGTSVEKMLSDQPYIETQENPESGCEIGKMQHLSVRSETQEDYRYWENPSGAWFNFETDKAKITRQIRNLPADTLSLINFRIVKYLELEDECGVSKRAIIPLFLPFEQTPEGAGQLARTVRTHFGIGSAVVFDYVELFENHGIRILFENLPEDIDSAAFYDSGNSNLFIVIRGNMNPEKQLFRIAFELGNAYMFTGGGLIQVKDVEQNRRFAAQFAAAFLMPEEAVRATVVQLGIKPDRWTYELLLRIKNRFGVSAEAFAHRLEEIGAVDKTLRQNLKARITEEYKMNGYAEPGTGRRELSRNGRFNDLALLAEIKRKHDQAPDAVQ